MRTKRILMSILLLLVTFSLVACGKVTVKLSGEQSLKVGQTINLTPEASKKGATFSWASSNDAVATVKDGAVTGVSAGKVTITVTATSGKKTGEASLEITVVADNKPVISGAEDTEVLKGVKFSPLEGVTARDEEDGDLTTKIQVEGSVNYNVVGTYTVTYTVKDKDNNVTTVTRTVTVVANDTDAPLLTGTSPKAIIVGDTQFNPLDNVSANDAIDGDVTSKIVVTGEVNVWKLGEYQIKYEVSDEAGNKAETTRTITVGLGEFQFEELADKEFAKVENDYQFAVALESINTQLSDFALAKLTFKVNAAAACELVPSITNGAAQAKIALAAGENEITIYFRVNSAIVEGNVKLAAPADASLTFSEVKFAFAEAKDVTAPVITVPEGKIVLPADVTDLAVLKGFILNGVTAQDNVDMVMNSKLDVDMTGIAAGTYEVKQVTIFAVDTAGNRGEATRTVEFAKAYSTNLITDPTFSTDSRYEAGTTDPIWKGFRLHGGAGEPEMYIADGVLVHHNTSNANPGYDSASCPIIDTDSTVLQGGNWYMLKFDVKAAVARQMSVRIGLAANEPIWLENFAGASNYLLNVTTEMTTQYVVFYVHADASADGYTGISCELKNGGAFDWNAEKEVGNTFYFDNLQFYLLTNENAAPQLTINKDLPTTFGKGQEKPDLTQYVIAYDREDAANITITAANITESIDMAAAGTYDVVYEVADSEGKKATITLQIKVLEQADTTAPVLTEAADLVKVFDQFSATPDITKFITATDDVDGAITITMDMIETDANLNAAGTYDIVYTVKDSSGNEATKTITITVNDKEGPKVVGKDLKTYVGTPLTAADIIANLTVTDNVDGAMTLTEANVKGLDQVKFNEAGEYQVTIEVTDAAGNKTEQVLKISVREKGNTKAIADEKIIDLAPLAPEKGEACVITEAEGVYKVEISAMGGWASANKMKFTPSVEQGETYVLRFTAKADKARPIQFNIGEALDGNKTNVWMEKYPLAEEGSDLVALTTEYKTFDIVFTVQNEKSEWGPTIEFCVGPVGAGAEEGNNIYFTELAIYSTKEIGDVNLLPVTIDPQHHILGEGLVVAKATNSGQWDWIGFKPEATDLEGYTKIVAKVYGPEGGVLLFKPNDLQPKETRYTMTGQWQEIEHELDFTLDASKQALILMPDADVVGTGKYYLIASLELQGEGKDPINLLDATISKADPCTAQKALTLTKATDNSEQYDCAKFQVSDDLTGYAGVKYAVIGTSGTTATLKPNDNGGYQRTLNLDGNLQEGIIDLAGMTYSTAKSAMILFVDLMATGSGNPVFILEMSYIIEKPGEPEPENPGHVEPIATAQSSSDFASWEGLETVTFTGLPTETAGGKWARWDFDGVEDKGYTDIVVKLKATPGLRINAKVDASAATAAGNNAYDSVVGNKTTLVAGEDGEVTFTWNIAELKAAIEAAGKVFNVNYLRKFVVFPSCGLEGDNVFTTGSIQMVSIDFVKNEPEEVYVPVYPEAVEGTDLITAAVTPNGMQVARQIRMMKTGGGQWDWVGLKTDADLTGYTKMVAVVNGPAGAPFVIKVNDKIEVTANGTGEAHEVEWTAPADFAWNAAAQTMIIFPDFNKAGESNEFTITKLELQGEDKDPIDLLLAPITLSNQYVQACRDLVVTKPTTNTGEWDCVILRLADFAGYDSIHYTVRGTEGEKLLFKLNDQQESWLTLNGKAQSGDIEFTGTYDTAKGALVLFPNAQAAGSGNPIVFSQIVAVKNAAPQPQTVKHELNASNMTLGTVEAELLVGEYFTVLPNGIKVVVDENNKTCGEMSFTQRLKLGGKSDPTKAVVKFTTTTLNAKVVVYAYSSSGSEEREVHIFDADKTKLATGRAVATGDMVALEYIIANPGTYYVGGLDAAVNIYGIVVEEDPTAIPAVELTGVKVGGAVDVDLVLNAETGLYEGKFSLENIWSQVRFIGTYSDESTAAFTYADTTFAGNGILPARVANSPENAQLYADSDELVNSGSFCFGIRTKTNYVVTYDPKTKTLTVDVEEPGADATLVGVSVVGSANADLVLNEQTGLYEGTFTLGTQWNTVQFIEKYSDDTQNPLTYANATIQGSGIKNEKVDGAPWTSALFIDTDAAVQTGTFCYSLTSETKYLVRYNPETKLLLVDVYASEVPATVKGVVYGGAKQGEFTLKAGKYEAVVSLNQWNRISFAVVDANDKQIALWYTNAKIAGDFTAEGKLGDAYNNTLYHESGDGLQWMPGAGSERTYRIVYDPSTKTLTATRYANEDLLSDLPNSKTGYSSSHWSYDQYQNDGTWKTLTSEQMRCREKPEGSGVWTTNMAVGTMPMRYIYNNGNKSLGLANKLTFNVWNDFAPVNVIQVKVVLVGVDGTQKYIVGGEDTWFDVAKNIANVPQTIEFDEFEVKNVVFIGKSSASGYIYFNNLKLTYEERGTAENPYTVEDALSLASKFSQSNYDETGDVVEMWVKGFVVDQGTDMGANSKNIKLASTANGEVTLLVFTVNETDSIKDVRLGDEVVIKGYLMNWMGTVEVSSTRVDGATVYPVFVSCTRGTNSVSVANDSSDKATVTEITPERGLNGSEFTFKVEVASGFQIVAVKVNGEEVEAAEGVYTGRILGPTSILVETAEAGVQVSKANISMNDVANDAHLASSGTKLSTATVANGLFVLTASGTDSNTGKMYGTVTDGVWSASNWRFYQSGNGTLTITVAEGKQVTITKVIVTYVASESGAKLTVDGADYESGTAVEVNGTTISFVAAGKKNCQISAIEISYTEDEEQPASSPAAFQLANLEAEGNARNHIEGAGAWIWIDASSMGLTAENKAEFTVEAETSGQAPAIVGQQLDDLANGAVRCYVTFANAEFAATTTINLTIHHGDVAYQGTVVFAGNELAQ